MKGNRAHRTDDNHAEVVAAFIALGCTIGLMAFLAILLWTVAGEVHP